MSSRDAAIVALADAVKFESDGRDFYLRAAQQAENPLAKSVFLVLADDEKDHLRRVREIYEQLKDKPGWPEVGAVAARQAGVMDAFEAAAANLAGNVAADADVEAALHTAIGMEQKGLAFYRERLGDASCDNEAEFYRSLVEEEELHLKTLRSVLAELVG
ncbi:MAG TPA: ferritin family protein [Deferrisomatales bacterium]|nr:ferritin family protein [Deferrisomatales bacterium]